MRSLSRSSRDRREQTCALSGGVISVRPFHLQNALVLPPSAVRLGKEGELSNEEQAVESDVPAKQRDIAEIRSLGIEISIGDLVKSSIDELASVFAQYDTVIGCAAYAAGIDTPMKLAK
jgi:hypothetical protein